jgi:HSP20 family protein
MLTRRPSERRITPFRSALEWLMEDPIVEGSRWTQGAMTPSIDVRETDDALVIEAEMPGVTADDIDVTLDGRTLSIRASQTEEREREGDNGRYLVRERQSSSYARVITLPVETDPEQVESTFENGELTLKIPKAAQNRSRRIPVRGPAKNVGPGSTDQAKTSATSNGRKQTAGSGTSR